MKLTLEQWRKFKRISQTQLADKLGVVRMTIYRYENGTIVPNDGMKDKIAEALGVEVKDIIWK